MSASQNYEYKCINGCKVLGVVLVLVKGWRLKCSVACDSAVLKLTFICFGMCVGLVSIGHYRRLSSVIAKSISEDTVLHFKAEFNQGCKYK